MRMRMRKPCNPGNVAAINSCFGFVGLPPCPSDKIRGFLLSSSAVRSFPFVEFDFSSRCHRWLELDGAPLYSEMSFSFHKQLRLSLITYNQRFSSFYLFPCSILSVKIAYNFDSLSLKYLVFSGL